MVAANRRVRIRSTSITRPTPRCNTCCLNSASKCPSSRPISPQVNHHINRVLVERALRLLDVQKTDRIADLFCGIGNFTLPLATRAREVVGIEGSTTLTERATENARINGLSEKTAFSSRNLFELSGDDWVVSWANSLVTDCTGRPTAREVARDRGVPGAGRLDPRAARVQTQTYSLCILQPRYPGARRRSVGASGRLHIMKHAGVVNMFPHTSHCGIDCGCSIGLIICPAPNRRALSEATGGAAIRPPDTARGVKSKLIQ